MAKSSAFVIAHLSDLHLTASDDGRRSEPRLFGALTGMNDAFRKVVRSPDIQHANLVLVTGDVTDRGDIDSWRVFWHGIRSAGLSKRVLVVPGNHDVCCLGARMPADSLADDDLKKAVAGLKMGRQPTKFPWVRQPDRRVVMFGLNSNNLGNLTGATNAMGQIGYFQLVALAGKMHKYRDVPVKIVALHHSPNIPEAETAKRRGQRPLGRVERLTHQIPTEQRRGLRLLCIAHRVRLVLHGHLHVKEDRRVTGIRIVGAPATTQPVSGADNEIPYFRYTVQGAGGSVRTECRTVKV
jgi:3',5'-cyclic AMP phosphodiesterase CpdA